MMIREYINKPQDLLAEGKELLQTSDDSVFAYRITMVNLLLAGNGPTTAELSELSGVPVRTLTDWVKKADETHFEALRPKSRPGKAPRLTEEQYAQIKETLTHEPEKFGYQVWDGKSLSDYIQKTYSVTLGVRQCQRIFHKLGFSRIRPQIFPALGEEDSEEREAFKKKVEDIKENKNAVLVYQDEVHFLLTALVGYVWALIGSRPKVKSAPGRKSIAYSGFVIPSTGAIWVNKPGWFTYESVIESIRDFLKNNPLAEGMKYYMVMDNAPWHRKAKRLIKENAGGIYQDIVDKVVFVYLPPYSPDLNPIEQVWRVVRREVTHNRYFATLESLIEKLDEYFSKYTKPNEKFASLCSFNYKITSVQCDDVA